MTQHTTSTLRIDAKLEAIHYIKCQIGTTLGMNVLIHPLLCISQILVVQVYKLCD